MTDEKQVCPRRNECPVPAFVGDHDTWETNRWNDRKHVKWPEGFDKPRTCSYCGGVHPEDIIKLIESGWEIDPSTKGYKWYINPPGQRLHHKRLINAIGDDDAIKEVFDTPRHESPIPPVKLYGQHATPEQLTKLNGLLNLQRTGSGGVQ